MAFSFRSLLCYVLSNAFLMESQKDTFCSRRKPFYDPAAA